ncbi:MAG: hypothetical protein NTY22_04485, partial [Proteobacteria bacterium]|nr:hypothetical protein [Pseudomonadota bacterium]
MRKSLAASKIYDWASFFLFSIIILISFFIFSDYSSCWDQFFHVEYGKAILNWYNSSFADKHAITGEGIAYNIRYYGGIFDVISTAFSRLVPFINDYTARRFMILLTGLSGLFFCWRLGRLLYGPKLGLFCLISIVTIPMYFGHMFFNPKDMPFAAAYICSLYFIIKILLDLPLLKKKNIVWLSCAIGFAAGVRISGFVIVMYLGLALILYKIFAGKYLSIPGNKKISIYSIIGILVFVSIVSFAIAMVCWPYLLTDPLRVFNVSKYIANFNGLKNEYVFGYLLSRFNSQLPELHTVLIYLGLMIGSLKVYSLYKNRSSLSPNVLSRAIGIF